MVQETVLWHTATNSLIFKLFSLQLHGFPVRNVQFSQSGAAASAHSTGPAGAGVPAPALGRLIRSRGENVQSEDCFLIDRLLLS